MAGNLMGGFRTHYDNLQVAETASIEVIKGAYKFLSQKWHPDKHPDNRAGAEKIMRVINDAYEVLSDPEKRKAHDAWIAEKRAKQAETAQNENDASSANSKGRNPEDTDDFVDDPDADTSQWEVPQKPEETKAHSPVVNVLSRLVARLIDLYLFVLVLGAFASAVPEGRQLHEWINHPVISSILAVMLWIPIDALFIYMLGGTPGKWLLGIDVQKRFGETLNIFDALQRSVGVAVLGMAGGVPPLFVFTNALAFKRYLSTHSTIWDESLGLTVKYRKWTPLHLTSAGLVVMVLLAVTVKSKIDNFHDPKIDNSAVTERSMPVDSDIPGLQVSNECGFTVKTAVSYVDLNDKQRTEGWWYVESGDVLKFTDDKGRYLKTRKSEWYFYSTIVGGPEYAWDGPNKFRFYGSVLPMQKVEDKEGTRAWSIQCPESLKSMKTITPVRDQVSRQPARANSEDSCVIKGIMTNEELARCRRLH